MRKLSLVFGVLVLGVGLAIWCAPGGVGAEDKESFTNLIGKDLTGWEVMNMPKDQWTVEDGVLIYLGKGNGWLRTEKPYTNFVLRVEWRFLKAPYDSGLFIRAGTEGSPWPKSGYQLQMAKGSEGTGVPGAKNAASTIKAPPEWNKWEVTVNGDEVTLVSNGEKVYTGKGAKVAAGHIGWQAEGHRLEVRKCEIKVLVDEK
ncbi:MAG: DUF1080 domain-containing protein [Planctomycetes bacterium]|nr:DUF1080 domain-containing protein [Planctomycetota bacterium]